MRLQKLLGRGRELLINWEAPMASTFISSFSAQGAAAPDDKAAGQELEEHGERGGRGRDRDGDAFFKVDRGQDSPDF